MTISLGTVLTAVRRRIAGVLIWTFVLQSFLRLGLMVQSPPRGRIGVAVHCATMILLTGVVAGLLLATKGRKVLRLIAGFVLAAVWMILTVYDINVLVARLLNLHPFPIDDFIQLYCETKNWLFCLADYSRITAIFLFVFLIWAGILALFSEEMADRIRPISRWMDRRLGKWTGLGVRPVLAFMCGAYILAWSLAPAFMVQREPLVYFLKPREFTEGPIELTQFDRPDFRVLPTPGIRPKTLVLITVDSLRADFVGLKSGQPTLTPFLHSLAESGKLQDIGPGVAICPQSFCGIIALQSSSNWASLRHGPPLMLADVLAANGYRSHFLLSGPHRGMGLLGRIYGPNVTTLLDDSSSDSSKLADDREQVRRLAGLTFAEAERNYLAIHLMSAHAAGLRFSGRERFEMKKFGDLLFRPDYKSFYAGGVAQADAVIRLIFAELKRKGLLENAVVVITADHGERTVTPSGVKPHGGVPDRETVTIPVLVYESRPSVWPRHALVGQADIAPTLLDAIGVRIPEEWLGQSLKRSDPRSAVSVDSFETTGMAGMVAGRKLLFSCSIKTGETTVADFGGRPLSSQERVAALEQAPALYATLAKRREAGRCFNQPAASPLRS